jgi:hypothetical protein
MRLGFLVAELFMALAVIFLVGSTVGHVTNPGVTPTPTPTMTPTPTPTPVVLVNCGLDPHLVQYPASGQYTLQDPEGLRSGTHAAVNALTTIFAKQFASNNRVAGLVEVYGSGSTVGAGNNLADGIIRALKATGGPFKTKTIYQSFGNTGLPYGTMYFYVFYYTQATVCS